MLKSLFYLSSILLVFLFIFAMNNHSSNEDHVILLQSWAERKLRQELAHFQTHQFQQSDIEKTYTDLSSIPENQIIRFQIVNNQIYTNSNLLDTIESKISYNTLINFFKDLIDMHPMNSGVDFLLVTSKRITIPENYTLTVPLIVGSKNTVDQNAKYLILAPNYKTIQKLTQWYIDNSLAADEAYPWDRKLSKALWYYTSQEEYSRYYWKDLSKTKLFNLAESNPNLIDIKFIIPDQNNELAKTPTQEYPFATLTYKNTGLYKMSITIDDANTSYSDYLWQLLSNTVPLKQKSTHQQWFYDILEEGRDYISFAPDLSDLLSKIEWLQHNDTQAQKIATAGATKIQKEITPKHLFLYWSKLLQSYSSLQKFEMSTPTLPPANVSKQ
jgi:hypothetical protein